MKKRYWLLAIFILAVVVFYLYPNPKKDFSELYNGDKKIANSLKEFREIPLSSITVDNTDWNYLALGKGEKTILFFAWYGRNLRYLVSAN